MVTDRAGLCITKAQSNTRVENQTVLQTLGVMSSCSTAQCNCSLQHCSVQADNACYASPCVPVVKCTNTLMTEAAAMLQHAALTTVTTNAFSVDWRCKQGHLRK
jgi:hypothetical protein